MAESDFLDDIVGQGHSKEPAPAESARTEPEPEEPKGETPEDEGDAKEPSSPERGPDGKFVARDKGEKEEAEREPKEPAQQPQDSQPQQPEPPSGKNDPVTEGRLSALLDEREKRQAAERERDDFKRQIQELQRQQQPRAETPPPDVLDDPKGYQTYLQNTFEQQRIQDRITMSRMMAEESPAVGKEKVDAALAAFAQACATDPALDQQGAVWSRNHPHPVKRVLEWYDQQQALETVTKAGGLDKLKEQWLAEQRASLAATPPQDAAPAQEEPQQPDPPGSLARGGSSPAKSSGPRSAEEQFDRLFSE